MAGALRESARAWFVRDGAGAQTIRPAASLGARLRPFGEAATVRPVFNVVLLAMRTCDGRGFGLERSGLCRASAFSADPHIDRPSPEP